jgi:uncharacterized RDD family membrane protein YckC
MENEYPSLIDRIQSIFIDTVLLLISIVILSVLLDKFNNVPDWLRMLLFFTVFVAYEPLCLTFGCTLGNYIKQIRVRQYADTNRKINIFQAIIRYLVKLSLGWLSFLTVYGNPSRRAIHDMASGSVMVWQKRKTPVKENTING